MYRFCVAAFLCLAALLSGCARGDTADAEAAYARGDYAAAMRQWRPLANAGDPDAQYALGYMYRNGEGVPVNQAEAARWYRKAADQGFAKAQVKLALMYAKGQGVAQSNVQAYLWFDRAARQGETKAAEARDLVAKRLSPEELAETRRLVENGKRK